MYFISFILLYFNNTIGKPDQGPELTTFEKYVHKVQPLDTTAIKNVYERVWLMQSIEKDALNKSHHSQGKGI